MKCPNCGKEFDEKTGRRPKRFCTDTCKVKFWNTKKKQKEPSPEAKACAEISKKSLAAVLSDERPMGTGNPVVDIAEKEQWKADIAAQIEKLTASMGTFGSGQLGESMKNATRKKIENLKKLLK